MVASFDAKTTQGKLSAIAVALADGSVSAASLIDTTLARIAAAQPALNAFRVVRADAARNEAADADRRLANGERAPLLGVPVAVKDDVDLAGETTPFGCGGNVGPPAREDSAVVRRLRGAGAVIVGKTNTPELGQWPFTEGPGFGVTRSPWSAEHTPGGSSGGSAAAVAAGLVPVAVGSDGAGSVRIPAAWCHLVGLKPQRGRISGWPDAELFHGLTCHGPLARSVDDAARLLDVLAGSMPGDRHRPPAPEAPYAELATRQRGRLRVALSFATPFGVPGRVDPQVRRAVQRVAEALAGLGHEVFPADPDYGLVGLSFVPRATNGIAAWLDRLPAEVVVEKRTRTHARLGRLLGGPALRTARAAEPALQRRVGRIFKRADVVLTPTTAQLPMRIGATAPERFGQTTRAIEAACPFAWAWNVLGWPGLSVPAGLSAEGLPIGAQLLGPANSEGLLLALGAQLEAAERWYDVRPPAAAAPTV